MRVGALAGHLLAQILNPRALLDAPTRPEGPLSLLEHYARTTLADADFDNGPSLDVRRAGADTAVCGPERVAGRAAAELTIISERLIVEPADRVVHLPWRGWSLTLDDFLLTRTLEIAVHGDDLAVSVEMPTPQLPAQVLDPVLGLLVRIASQRHGGTAVLRTLSRTERAPGDVSAF
jgi:hypothetical protein